MKGDIRTVNGIFRKIGKREGVEWIAGYVNERARGWHARGLDIENELSSWPSRDDRYSNQAEAAVGEFNLQHNR